MFSKYSVRKPFTVLVAVILVVVLGVVSYMNMTPDLLPKINLPYVVVMTTYVGATPETVESEVTRPIEQSLSTLDDVDTITSTSGASYSVVFLQFADNADLEYASLAIREKLTQLSGSWSDDVGTPSIMKISPDLLPVSVAAVSREGHDTITLSSFVEDELLTRLEGVEGIAGVNASGLISQVIEVKIDPDKLEEVNARLRAEAERQLEDAKAQLTENRTEVQNKLDELSGGAEEIADGRTQLTQKQESLATELAAAEAELDNQKQTILQARLEIVSGLAELESKLAEIDTTEQTYRTLQSNIEKAEFAREQGTAAANNLTALSEQLSALLATRQAMLAGAATMGLSGEEAEKYLRENSEEFRTAESALAEIDTVLAAAGTDRDQLPQAIDTAKTAAETAEKSLDTLDSALAAQGLTRETLTQAIAQLEDARETVSASMATLNDKLGALEQGETTVDDALATLAAQQSAASGELNSAMTELIVNEKSLAAAKTELETALAEIDDAYTRLEDSREETLAKADVTDAVTMKSVAQILAAQNFSMPVGYAGDTLVSVEGNIDDAETLEGLLLFDLEGVGEVRLADVATVTLRDNSDESYARINGQDGVLLSFTKQSDVPTATASKNLAAKLADLEAEFDGLRFYTLMDQGDYIRLIVKSVLENLFLGAALAILILLFFLKDIRPTFVVACAIPLSVTFAIVLMYFSGVTLNILSLSGLAIGVGMLVDNAIVVIENIYRLRGKGVPPVKAAIAGAKQVTAAITASTLTTVCVFLPIVFVQGLTRQLFTDMALTITYSLGASLIVALTLVPCMAAGTLKRVRPEGSAYGKLLDRYEAAMRWSLAHKWTVVLAAFVLLAGSAVWSLSKGFSYMPDMESTQVMVSIEMPDDSTLSETAAASDTLAQRIMALDGVETVGTMLDAGVSGMLGMSVGTDTDVTSVTMYVLLAENSHRSMSGLAEEIEASAEGLECKVSASSGSMMSGYATALGGQGIEVKVYANDLDLLQNEAKAIAELLRGVDGIAEVSDGLEQTAPALRITVDRDKAMKNGLTTAQVAMSLASSLTKSATATQIHTLDADVLVYNTVDANPETLGKLTVTATAADGTKTEVRLGDIAEIREATSFSAIRRSEQRRTVSVTATVQEGKNVTIVARDIEKAMKSYAAPAGVSYEYAGENETIMNSLSDLVWMLLLGVLIVYLIMVAQFQSLLSPLIVMFAIPLAFTGGLFALAIFGYEVSVVAMIGFIILVGIIVNNGIVLVDAINQLREEGMERTEAVIEAGRMRLRPVLMTALTTILGLMPMSLGIGLGVSLVQPVAIAGIGGLAYATLMTLILVPVLYDGLHKRPLKRVTAEELQETEETRA
ncbi:MAG: efflux RND transporter permease subunit [Clostridiaceae bacterium]|nr:efflux RND transporter permease subunit [Clostridiaceae bacterium]